MADALQRGDATHLYVAIHLLVTVRVAAFLILVNGSMVVVVVSCRYGTQSMCPFCLVLEAKPPQWHPAVVVEYAKVGLLLHVWLCVS